MSQTADSLQTIDPYYSRIDEWEMTARVDPVVWNEGQVESPWSNDQIASYKKDGFLYQKQLFTETEAKEMLAEAERLADKANPSEEGVIGEPDSNVIRSIFRLHEISELFKFVCRDSRLVDAARQVLGGDVYIHQSRINFKPAFDGKEFFWHSDFETWHMEDGMPRMRALSVSLSLTPTNDFNGPLIVIPGSQNHYVRCAGATPENHFEQSLKKQEIGVPSREALEQLVEQSEMVAPTGPAGSALFFDCNTMHGSAGNISPYSRINLFLVFNSMENKVVEPFGKQPPRPDYLAERTFEPVSSMSDS